MKALIVVLLALNLAAVSWFAGALMMGDYCRQTKVEKKEPVKECLVSSDFYWCYDNIVLG